MVQTEMIKLYFKVIYKTDTISSKPSYVCGRHERVNFLLNPCHPIQQVGNYGRENSTRFIGQQQTATSPCSTHSQTGYMDYIM